LCKKHVRAREPSTSVNPSSPQSPLTEIGRICTFCKLWVVTFEEEPLPLTKPLPLMELVGKSNVPLSSFKGPPLSLTEHPWRFWRLRSQLPSDDRRKCFKFILICVKTFHSPTGVSHDCASGLYRPEPPQYSKKTKDPPKF